MDYIKEQITQRGVKDSTIKTYVSTLNRLAISITGEEWVSTEFLTTDFQKVMDLLETFKLSKRRSTLSAICVGLSPSGADKSKEEDKEVYDKYKPMIWEISQIINEEKKNQKKNPKEDENWAEWKELTKLQKLYFGDVKRRGFTITKTPKHPMPNDVMLLNKMIVSALYTLQPPRRLEYANMMRITEDDYNKLEKEEKESWNLLVIKNTKKMYFSFADVKIVDKESPVIIVDVAEKLIPIMRIYLKATKTFSGEWGNTFLVNSSGNQTTGSRIMSQATLSQLLSNIVFAPTGSKISVTMLRHIYLSHIYKDETSLKDKEELATKMNHSVNIQETIYIKKD